MRPRITNAKRRAFDAYKLSFESAGALGLQFGCLDILLHLLQLGEEILLVEAEDFLVFFYLLPVDGENLDDAAVDFRAQLGREHGAESADGDARRALGALEVDDSSDADEYAGASDSTCSTSSTRSSRSGPPRCRPGGWS